MCGPMAPAQPPAAGLKRLRRVGGGGWDQGEIGGTLQVTCLSRAGSRSWRRRRRWRRRVNGAGLHSVCTCVGLCTREAAVVDRHQQAHRLAGIGGYLVGLQKYAGGSRQRSARGVSA